MGLHVIAVTASNFCGAPIDDVSAFLGFYLDLAVDAMQGFSWPQRVLSGDSDKHK